MSNGLKKRILSSSHKLPTATVEIPEWADEDGNAAVLGVVGLTADQAIAIEELTKSDTRLGLALAIEYSVTDPETGKPLFSREESLEILGGSQDPVKRLGEAIHAISPDGKAAKANFTPAPSSVSATSLHSGSEKRGRKSSASRKPS